MAIVLDAGEIGRALKRIAHEIIEHNHGLENVVLLGIPTRGAFLSERIGKFLSEMGAISRKRWRPLKCRGLKI